MENSDIAYTCFIALTNQGYWGRGKTLAEAKENAHWPKRPKEGFRGGVKLNIQGDSDRIDDERLAAIKVGDPDTKLEVGNFCPPAINDHGGVHWFGALIDIE